MMCNLDNVLINNKKTGERNLSIDLLKIFSCVLVVLMHTLRHFDATVALHPILYYFTRCSMPLFFMAAGAIQLNKPFIDMKYCWRKIGQIILVMAGYYAVDLIVRLFVSDFSAFVLSDAIFLIKQLYWDFGVFWFLRTMIYIYLFLPLLHKVYHKYTKYMLMLLMVICVSLDIASVLRIEMNGVSVYLQKGVMQEFRFWTWLMYYSLGGFIYSVYKQLAINRSKLILIYFVTSTMAVAYMYIMFQVRTNIVNGEYAYDTVFMILWAITTMLLFLKTNFNKNSKEIQIGASLLMPVYALHMFFIEIIEDVPFFHSYFMQIVGYLLILFSAALVGYLMTKVPVIKRFTYI